MLIIISLFQKLYSEKCHDFHIEEVKVTTEYVHNEL